MNRISFVLGRYASLLLVVIASLVMCLPALPAAAQESVTPEVEVIRPPTPGKQDSPPIILYWLVLGVTILLVVGVNLMPSKRGHQD